MCQIRFPFRRSVTAWWSALLTIKFLFALYALLAIIIWVRWFRIIRMSPPYTEICVIRYKLTAYCASESPAIFAHSFTSGGLGRGIQWV